MVTMILQGIHAISITLVLQERYMPLVKIKDFDVLIDNKLFCD